MPGIPHHLTQRGNRREEAFFSDDDRQRYLQLLLEYSAKHRLETLAYCLMTNHIHLVCIPARADSLSLVMKPLDLRHAQHVNWTHGISGRLWQGRFFSCPLDEEHLCAALRYVTGNPVRARLVRRAENYAWSSAAADCAETRCCRACQREAWRGRRNGPHGWRKETMQRCWRHFACTPEREGPLQEGSGL